MARLIMNPERRALAQTLIEIIGADMALEIWREIANRKVKAANAARNGEAS